MVGFGKKVKKTIPYYLLIKCTSVNWNAGPEQSELFNESLMHPFLVANDRDNKTGVGVTEA
ncbi:MAG: hypothetical protein C0403_12005 [Desulfobacterium sp.]|nr:hypothetical protein [Desulfobacterium sp.]